jgi:2-polyprenyl-6-methoxyphenol hydroxylase-like FAD-dependent oxidoreductase
VILGGGPAGSMAAIRALGEGARVGLIERSRFPRHKVCGEFLSPEIEPLLEAAGIRDSFLALAPAPVRRMVIRLGAGENRSVLPEPAFGLSRFAFDDLLWRTAIDRGASPSVSEKPTVIASGRPPGQQAKGGRLFGFKAHFTGPADDAVELYFARETYTGINCIEDGRTNICGLAPESALRAVDFNPEAFFAGIPALRERVAPLTRVMDWLFTGPLDFRQQWQPADSALLCGDALSFVDPFTGSGILTAVLTGSLAGVHAARGIPPATHLDACRRAIGRPFAVSSALRSLALHNIAEFLLPWIPGRWLYNLTRPVT